MIKVLHLIDHIGLGGVQTYVKEIFEKRRENRDIFLYVLRKSPITLDIDHPDVRVFPSSSKYSLGPLRELKRLIEAESFDVLHCHLFRSQAFGYFLKQRYFPRLKLVFQEQGRVYLGGRVFNCFLKISRPMVDRYIANSYATRDVLSRSAGIPEGEIKVLYNPVDLRKFQSRAFGPGSPGRPERAPSAARPFTVGFAARLIERKGWKEFIEAAALLIKEKEDLRFLIAGDGPDMRKVSALIEKLGVDGKIFLLGYVADMAGFYSSLDCFVISSHWEPMGLTEVEAQFSGVPVIASNVAALNEIIFDGENGLLFEAGSSADLAQKISAVMDDPLLRDKLIKGGLENSERYSPPRHIKALEDIYEEICRA